ncbi:hypothetical protein BGW36DRAFT_412163 [Talaromyces proteolyticus]|uniref:Uncharacterized protein n=1 Tax=Talaromyces proteolyticus TaxID=1131652 RepID=A0AAD4KIJ6_9EURO|nr:uncharacterized protein BGW36DRAFT_412163 [Talaromyces proteolyticus]KAH8689330.1 hypothetical protein BGW36DRAFT_412163 [Talaromyces proteolyticus]
MVFFPYGDELPHDWNAYLVPGRCSLCSFELTEGERVVTVMIKDEKVSHECVVTSKACYTDERAKILYELDFRDYIDLHHDNHDNFSCHGQCISMYGVLVNKSFFQAMHYSYNPSPPDIARRNHWLRSDLASLLHEALGPFLIPLEICDKIAQRCSLREQAASIANAFWRKNLKKEHEGQFKVSLASNIWARYVEFEGAQYISYLTNTPGNHPEQMSKVFSAQSGQKVKSLYVAEYHLGVRQLRFSRAAKRNPTGVETVPGQWWRTFECKKGTMDIEAYNDGIKLRFVEPAEHKRSHFYDCAFEMPIYPHYLRQLHWHRLCSGYGYITRMISLVLNDPRATAYSASCDYCPYTIRAHLPGAHDPYFYDAGSIAARNAVWLYMPIHKDERITQIWLRQWVGKFFSDSALLFCMNTGNTYVMGLFPAADSYGHYSYTLIYESSTIPDLMFFDIKIRGIEEFEFENPVRPQTEALPKLPQPESFLSGIYYEKYNYFFSSASLEEVVEVTPCLLEVSGFGPAIMGLLLQYEDGRRAAVGQVRTDRFQSSLAVNKSSWGLCLQFSRSAQDLVNVSSVDVQSKTVSDDKIEAGLEIPWQGKLEWWFCSTQSWLYHKSGSSPMPFLGTNKTFSEHVQNITPTVST